MKAFIAMLTAAGFIVAAYMLYEMSNLRGEIEKLESSVASAARTAEDLKAAEERRSESPRWKEMEFRVARLEEEARSAPAESSVASEMDLSEIQARLTAHDEEIAEMLKDLEGVRRTRGALDNTADRVLSALGQEDAAGTEGGQGGMERLLEMGALFRKRPEDLTDEERAQRDEITNQLRRRQSEWAVRSFDRTLAVKLSDQQRTDIQQLLDEERTALDASRGQDQTEEQRSAARKQVQAQTDQRAASILSAEQYESWTSYRSRSGRERMLGRFGRGE